MAFPGWFDPELIPKSWFDSELTPAAWFDSEIIDSSPVSGGITATFSVTESQDASTISAVTGHAGALSVSDAADTSSLIGKIGHVGTSSIAESQDTAALNGSVFGAKTGTLAITEVADAFDAAGTVPIPEPAISGGGWVDAPPRRKPLLHLATITAIESADGCVMQGKVVRQLSIVINEPGDGCEMRGEVDIYAAAKAEDEFWLMVA